MSPSLPPDMAQKTDSIPALKGLFSRADDLLLAHKADSRGVGCPGEKPVRLDEGRKRLKEWARDE
jgi:hypothetical protein